MVSGSYTMVLTEQVCAFPELFFVSLIATTDDCTMQPSGLFNYIANLIKLTLFIKPFNAKNGITIGMLQ